MENMNNEVMETVEVMETAEVMEPTVELTDVDLDVVVPASEVDEKSKGEGWIVAGVVTGVALAGYGAYKLATTAYKKGKNFVANQKAKKQAKAEKKASEGLQEEPIHEVVIDSEVVEKAEKETKKK